MICERCGHEHDGSYGSGRFCSIGCANKRKHSEETKRKIGMNLKKPQENKKSKKYICDKCGKQFESLKWFRKNRHIHCNECKRKVKNKGNIDNIKLSDLSTKTVRKIFKRMGLGCSICNWNKIPCDLHHITQKSKGGDDNTSNLAYICPNCHRLVHAKKIQPDDLISLDTQIGDKWKEYYFR